MKKQNLITLILAVLIIPVNTYPLNKNSALPEIREEKSAVIRIKLFNGRNLDGWYTYIKERGKNTDPLNVFTVKNGMIRISGEEYGCITTNNEFENYKLTVKFRWGEQTFPPRTDKARDSGILLHSVGEDGASSGTWMYSIECQIIEGGSGDFIVVGDGSTNFSITCPVAEKKQGNSFVFNPSGKMVTINSGRINWFARDPGWKDVRDFRGINDIEKPVGKWNLIECIVNGNEIDIYLNGVLVNQAFNLKPQKGKIQIQSEGAEIFFKKIIITPL
ncbi:MAG TPA: DUF1080 domain-containing protein [Bacteroidales bacterium]|nr:DUF1080 domain-containing protein [Bacteroidales bacterium]